MAVYQKAATNFASLIEPFSPSVQETASRLRQIIQTTLPQLTETVSGGLSFAMALYSVNKPTEVICGIQPNTKGCKFFIHFYGAIKHSELKIQGSGQHARHIKFTHINERESEQIADILHTVFIASHY